MKFHTSLPVVNLQKSLPFYELLFGEAPVKIKSDYAKFLPSWGGLNLSLHESALGHLALKTLHLGIQFEDQDSLNQAEKRMRKAGWISSERDTSVCCYASQDKVWVTDPNGYKWELYVLLADTDKKIDKKTGCCGAGMGSKRASASTCC
jgi:catechol 2,3-dioxygenase-like lactoylglutathione lyase family enzyme